MLVANSFSPPSSNLLTDTHGGVQPVRIGILCGMKYSQKNGKFIKKKWLQISFPLCLKFLLYCKICIFDFVKISIRMEKSAEMLTFLITENSNSSTVLLGISYFIASFKISVRYNFFWVLTFFCCLYLWNQGKKSSSFSPTYRGVTYVSYRGWQPPAVILYSFSEVCLWLWLLTFH